MDPGGHQAGDMGHIHHQIGTHGVGHFPELGEVNDAGIGAGTGNDELGLAFLCHGEKLIIVDALRLVVETVGDDVKVLAGDVHRAAVAEMAAVSQVHAQNRVAGLDQGEEGRQIGIGTGVGLNVGVLAAKELAGPFPGDLLRDIHGVAAAVVPLAGIALGVLVGQAGAHGQHDSFADDILGRDQLNIAPLPGKFLLNGGTHFGIDLGEIRHGFVDHRELLLRQDPPRHRDLASER